MATRTYSCGSNGVVKRLDNLAGAWVNVSTPSTNRLNDIKTDPTNTDKVFTVGMNSTILVSSNAGASWASPGGNFGILTINFWEVWPQDTNIIYAVGTDGTVVKSIDGGLNFNLAPTFATPTGLSSPGNAFSVHFISATIGVASFQQYVLKTIDGGTTWVVLNGGALLPDSSPIVGIHLSSDEQTIVAVGGGDIHRSINGGTSFTQVQNFPDREGLHLTWVSDTRLWATARGTERLRSIDAGATWTILSPYVIQGAPVFAAHFYAPTQGFFSLNNSLLDTNDAGLTGSPTDNYGPAASIMAVWTATDPPVCYVLTDCNGTETDIITSQDLSAYVGQTVTIQGSDTCWTVSSIQSGICKNAGVVIIDVLQDCSECNSPCFLLEDCTAQLPDIITSVDLSLYVGMIIKILGCGDTCWMVSQTTNCTLTTPVTITLPAFEDCTECLPETASPSPLAVKPRESEPGYITPGCPPEYTEKVNCNFADQIWKLVLSLRYGIEACCEEDLQKWTIKKSLLDLDAIKDPDICATIIADPCCPPCDVSATLTIFVTRSCMPVENVNAVLTLV